MRPYGEVTGHCVHRRSRSQFKGKIKGIFHKKIKEAERMAIWREYRKKERQRTRLKLRIEGKQNLEGN